MRRDDALYIYIEQPCFIIQLTIEIAGNPMTFFTKLVKHMCC